jgi:enoyl-CoA hydratase/carnithine racemase
MDSPSSTLRAETIGHVLRLTLNRPERLNALDRELMNALERMWTWAGAQPSIRVIVITGEGRAFSSGADVGGLQAGAKGPTDPGAVHVPKFTNRQAGIWKPTICAVNGVCAGAGLHFVADSDIVIASENASFVDTHVNVGQVTALEPIGLLRRMSMSAVLRMVVLGKAERLSAPQALDANMVSEVTPPETLQERAMQLAEIIAGASPASVQRSLRAVWESFELPLSKAYENGFEILIRHRSHPDALEGTTAFMEKREPRWSDSDA